MADEPDNQMPQSPQSAHEGQQRVEATGLNEVASAGHDNAGEGQPNRAEIERERRARGGFIKQMCEHLGIDDEVAAALAEQVELLRPNAERMSTSEDVAERLLHAIEGPFGSRNKLIKPRGTASDCDLANADGKRDLTKSPLGDILKSEHDLLYALIINEQMKGCFEARAAQHDSLTRMLRAEFVRRHHLHETWRHMVPKRFLPLIAALIAADVKYDDIKANSALLNALLKAIADWYKDRNGKDVALKDAAETGLTGTKALQAAAQKTGEELLAVMRESFADTRPAEEVPAPPSRLTQASTPTEQQPAGPDFESGPKTAISKDATISLQDRNAVPSSDAEWREVLARAPRSTGLSRSIYDRPFAGWADHRDRDGDDPRTYIPLRYQPDLSSREGKEGPIEPADLARIEVGPGPWRMVKRIDICDLGTAHALMLPPHSSLRWYGEELGWSAADCDKLSGFGSPARPYTVTANGNIDLLMKAFRLHAERRVKEISRQAEGSSAPAGQARATKYVIEQLSPYWLFVLLARHRQDQFCNLLGEKFFHGVLGPDFVLQPDHSEMIVREGMHQHFVQIYSPSVAEQTRRRADWDQQNPHYNDPEYELAVIQYNHLRDFIRVIEFGSCY